LTPARDPSSIRGARAPAPPQEVNLLETIKRDAEALAIIAACLVMVGSAGAALSLVFRFTANLIGA